MSDLLERLRDMAAGKSDDLDIAAEAIEEIIDLNWRVVLIEEERDALRAQIAEHQRICAGTMVPVTERLPEAWVEVPVFIPGPNPDMQIGFDEVDSLGNWQAVTGATHWIDVRMPGEER